MTPSAMKPNEQAPRAVGAVRIHPACAQGTVQIPASKSVTHRAFLLAALSESPAMVGNPLHSADTTATLNCLHALGARFQVEAGAVRFEPAPLQPPRTPLDCANSGTTLRLLAATSARLTHTVTLTGDASLRSRPNGQLLDALHHLGARIRSDDGRAPLTIQGPLRAGNVNLPAHSSSQFASALALALPFLEGRSRLTLARPVASRPYLDLTLDLAARAGLRLTTAEDGGVEDTGALSIEVPGNQHASLGAVKVEGDWSSAAFPLAAAALTQGHVTVTGLSNTSRQGDRAFLDHLKAFGCQVEAKSDGITVTGPSHLESPGTIDVTDTPDLFPILAVLAARSRGTTTLSGGSQLRSKETDRIHAMLQRLGAKIELPVTT